MNIYILYVNCVILSNLTMEHDALGLVCALGDVVFLPLVSHDLSGHAESRRGHQDAAAGHRGRHADAGQREAAPGGEGGQSQAKEGQRATLMRAHSSFKFNLLHCCISFPSVRGGFG